MRLNVERSIGIASIYCSLTWPFGNLIAEKRGKDHSLVTHYEYDCRHRLIKVIKPTGRIITYTYDAFNRRTSKTVDGKTTEFFYSSHP
jgi:YD repeat-containing protein